MVYHPHKKTLIASASAVFSEDQASEKELALIDLCLEQKKLFRRVLVYTIYTGVRDTASRLKRLLERQGLKVSVLRATVSAETREAWIEEEVERGCDVLICNPELVKTGLDLLEFPTIAFMQTGYNVYTVIQASRRSWRLGQTQPIHVYFFGYAGTAQETALKLMAQKIAVSQSVSGDVPDCGLDILNTAEDSIDVEIAKQLLAT
jgi:SNF2 family DNA or RNA helicase